jgi:lipopolysaccharide/colanic/teichoic acid biosynthesis glycosyltransferase
VVPAVSTVSVTTPAYATAGGGSAEIHDIRPLRRGAAAMKRAVDVVGALIGLLLALPVLALAAIAIKLETAGGVFFRQTRLGGGGRPFTMYKLRTMAIGNDDAHHSEYVTALIEGRAEKHGRIYKLSDDPRRTRLGRFLRATSLDELPQLVNVLRGDMSLVGPRPSTPEEASCWDERARGRLRLKPGITGLWQVSGRSRLTYDQMIELDLEYGRSRSLLLDLVILARTPLATLRAETA